MHIAAPCVVMGVAYALFPWAVSRSALGGLACLTCGVVGVYTGSGTTTALLRELAVASGASFAVAGPLYNGIGNVGGFIGPFMVGALVQQLNSFTVPSIIMAACLVMGGLMVGALPLLLDLPSGVRVGLLTPRPT